MIQLSSVLRPAPDLRYRTIDDETVVIRQEAAQALVLNEVAGRILHLVDGQRTAAAVIESLAAEYEVDYDILAEDVTKYLAELVESGLLVDSARE